jgi:predicted AlkP superfamily pyrophosphatase or phosphodiesterase
MFKRLWICLFALLLSISTCIPCTASAYDDHPKLVVILVIDQFREDYLERYRADFKGDGFDLFLDHGAYFPDCYFDYANLVTAAGHSAISTGAYSDGNGIASNEWWDLARNTKRPISSVEDPRYSIVGLPAAAPESAREGASPRNLLASTIGDEVRLATKGESKLFGISLKDRAAILTAGYTANGAFWIDPQSGAFVTSTYYMPSLPDWATTFNQSDDVAQARTAAGVSGDGSFFTTVGPTDAVIQYELNFAQALIKGENLGAGNVTDVLTISISSTDILGHRVGPDSPEQRQLVDQLDGNLDQFFTWLDHNIPGGLQNVWLVLTADHGVAPVPATAQQLGIPAATISMKPLIADLNKNMNERFSPGQNLEYLLPDQDLPYISLNTPTFERAGINEFEAERAIQDSIPGAVTSLDPSADKADAAVQPGDKRVPPQPRVFGTFTRLQLASLQPGLPPTEFGRLMAHSYSPNGGWYVMLVPDAYQVPGSGHGATHFSPYSYDRHVPLGFYGSVFTPGTFHGRVQPVDIAATLASLLGVNQPSAGIGHILTQAIHPEVAAKPKRDERRRRSHPETSRPAHTEAPAGEAATPAKTLPTGHTPVSTTPATPSSQKAPASQGPQP